MSVRIPTTEEYRNFTGNHCAWLWRGLGEDWRCPGCGRSKIQIMRWGRPKSSRGVRGEPTWLVGLHRHHDHRTHIGLKARFPETVICSACNGADGAVKARLALPVWFSFSPAEIPRFVSGRPHQGHLLDYGAAAAVWAEVGPGLVHEAEQDQAIYDHHNRAYASACFDVDADALPVD